MHPQILVLSTACCAFFRRSSSCGSLGPWWAMGWLAGGFLLELLGANKELSFAKESTNHHSHIIHVWYIDLHPWNLTACTLKYDAWKTSLSFWEVLFFQGLCQMSGVYILESVYISICTATWFTTCVFCYGNMDICILYILYPCTLILF